MIISDKVVHLSLGSQGQGQRGVQSDAHLVYS